MPETTLVRGHVRGRDEPGAAEADLTAPLELLAAIGSAPERGSFVRIYRPYPTLAFSRREAALPGFEAARDAARARGFAPVIRPAGGRAVALDEGWIVLELVTPEGERRDDRVVFAAQGERFAAWLRGLGVDARVGSVPGEYCPGDYSVNARGRVKLIGTAQRVARGARLFAASVPLRISEGVRAVLDEVNTALGLEWDPASLGALDIEAPTVMPDEIEAALITLFAGDGPREASIADILTRSGAPVGG